MTLLLYYFIFQILGAVKTNLHKNYTVNSYVQCFEFHHYVYKEFKYRVDLSKNMKSDEEQLTYQQQFLLPSVETNKLMYIKARTASRFSPRFYLRSSNPPRRISTDVKRARSFLHHFASSPISLRSLNLLVFYNGYIYD